MFKCIIVDDEVLARSELKYMLEKYDEIDVVGEAENAIEALKLNEENQVDLMFVDIKMPKISGIELAEILMERKNPPKIVFVTAYDKFAIQAFKVNAIDYLLKPIDDEELDKTIKNKIYPFMDNKDNRNDEKYEEIRKILFEIDGRDRNLSKITVNVNEKLIPIDFSEIIYITVEDKETVIRTKENKYTIGFTLSELYEKLKDERFFRSHKSFIVNTNYIDIIEPWFNSTLNLKMKIIEETIPVSRSNVKKFKSIMNVD